MCVHTYKCVTSAFISITLWSEYFISKILQTHCRKQTAMTDQEPTDFNTSEITDRVKNGELTIADKKGRSKVWLVFGEILKSNGELIPNYVFCKSCKKAFKYVKQTSNLVKHKCYVDLYGQDATLEPGDIKSLPEILTRWLIKECLPYELLQSKGLKAAFREFVRLGAKCLTDVDVNKIIPSQTEITNSVTQIKKQCFERLKAEITTIKENGFGLTSSIKTDVTKQSIIVLTAHYIKNGALKFHFLGLRFQNGGKSINQDFLRKIKQILEDFDCELSNRNIIVGDSSNPFFKTITDAQNLPCISQLLSDAIIISMEEIPEIWEIKNICSNLVKLLTQHGHETVLVGLQQESHQNSWMTIYNILKCIERNWSEIENTLLNLSEKALSATLNVSRLKALIKALQPFEEAIESLENDSYGTLHYVILYLHELKKSCDTDDNEFQDYEFIEQLKRNLRIHLEKLMSENITILHKIALFLYPPTNKLLQFSDKEKICIEDECVRLMQNYTYEVRPIKKFESETPIDAAISKRRKLFSDFIEPESNNYAKESFISEIQLYKNTRVINSPDFDVFNWWKLQKETFPFLYKLSCTVLATPATCAASKRILFKAKSMQMTNEVEFEKIMFVNSNAGPDELESYFATVDHDRAYFY